MAKKAAEQAGEKVNKAQRIREYLAANPNSKPKDVVEALGKEGVKITTNYIATVQYHQNGGPTKSGKKKKGELSVTELKAMRRLTRPLGDLKQVSASLKASREIFEAVGNDWDRAEQAIQSLQELYDAEGEEAPPEK
jgi:hypothetical protein